MLSRLPLAAAQEVLARDIIKAKQGEQSTRFDSWRNKIVLVEASVDKDSWANLAIIDRFYSFADGNSLDDSLPLGATCDYVSFLRSLEECEELFPGNC